MVLQFASPDMFVVDTYKIFSIAIDNLILQYSCVQSKSYRMSAKCDGEHHILACI